MECAARSIDSPQPGTHADLEKVVRRHLASPYQRPIAEHTASVFAKIKDRLQGPWILDSGCGVGESTLHLALEHPQHLVLGVDKSADRISKNAAHAQRLGLEALPSNMLVVRADLEDLWRLCLRAGLRPERHYLLYPNPWPKPAHLFRRWHGHPVFGEMLALCPWLELRTNWLIYAHEFATALRIAGATETSIVGPCRLSINAIAMTPFERKYNEAGQELYLVRHQSSIEHPEALRA